MVVTGPACRLLKRVGACCTIARCPIWLLIILVVLTIGLGYTGFHNRESFAAYDDGNHGMFLGLKKHIEDSGYPTIPPQSDDNNLIIKNERVQQAPAGIFIPPDENVSGERPKQVVFGSEQKNVELDIKKYESVNFKRRNITLPTFEGFENKSRGNRGTVEHNDTLAATNRDVTKIDFQCPQEFVMNDPDNEWFRTSIAQKSEKYDVTNGVVDDVVILTPISNVKRHLHKYFENICSLTYPHRHISLVLGEDSSTDGTLDEVEGMASVVRPYFKRVEVIRLKGKASMTSGHARHEMSYQLIRRRHLAMARNQLLFSGLRDEKWVLWTDSDIRHIPADLIERLLWPQKSIVVANCLYRRDGGQTDTFDRNTWRETEESKRHLMKKSDDFLMLEGYEPTRRKFLNDMKEEGDVVKIDGVGGCVLLIEADIHRKGLVFPSFIFDHHVETEGLAKMAARMGVEMYGLPSVNVIHW